jgi:hypothetical protein
MGQGSNLGGALRGCRGSSIEPWRGMSVEARDDPKNPDLILDSIEASEEGLRAIDLNDVYRYKIFCARWLNYLSGDISVRLPSFILTVL